MESKNICPVFPAFGAELSGIENKIISANKNISDKYFQSASNLLGISINKECFFDESLTDELLSQYKTYIFSSILIDILNDKIGFEEYTAGYSMGIYASLYLCKSITFEEGLLIIKNAYEIITVTAKENEYGMGSIIGLEYEDINKIIKNNSKKVEIINQNNKLSFVLSGVLKDVKEIIEAAKEEGAINIKTLPISAPYHSAFLKDAAENFAQYLKNINIKDSKYKIVSGHDQRVISKKNEIINELIINIYSRHSWLDTMTKLIALGIKHFFECGAGKSLYKTAKFIEGDYKFYTIKNLDNLIIH